MKHQKHKRVQNNLVVSDIFLNLHVYLSISRTQCSLRDTCTGNKVESMLQF
jgi:hypothetical protein